MIRVNNIIKHGVSSEFVVVSVVGEYVNISGAIQIPIYQALDVYRIFPVSVGNHIWLVWRDYGNAKASKDIKYSRSSVVLISTPTPKINIKISPTLHIAFFHFKLSLATFFLAISRRS